MTRRRQLLLACLAACLGGCLLPEVDSPHLDEAMGGGPGAAPACKHGVYPSWLHQGSKDYQGECTLGAGLFLGPTDQALAIKVKHVKVIQGPLTYQYPADLGTVLPALESADHLAIAAPTGPTLTGPASLTSLESLVLNGSTVQKLHGFEGLKAMEGVLSIQQNKHLLEIDAFHQLASVKAVDIGQNPELIQLAAFDALSQCQQFSVAGNARLVLGPKLGQLAQVQGQVIVQNLPLLAVVDWFPMLKQAGGLFLSQLPACHTLTFPNLTALGQLALDGVPQLESLAGLPYVTVSSGLRLCLQAMKCSDVTAWQASHAPSQPPSKWQPCAQGDACQP